jgi:hypothetical protein
MVRFHTTVTSALEQGIMDEIKRIMAFLKKKRGKRKALKKTR